MRGREQGGTHRGMRLRLVGPTIQSRAQRGYRVIVLPRGDLDLAAREQRLVGAFPLEFAHDGERDRTRDRVAAEGADGVGWMSARGTGETATANDLFDEPLHPYTQGLLKSLPRLG